MIDVHTANTPNGIKIPIALEELGIEYRIIRINLSAKEQKAPEFLKISPNGRIPAIVDQDGPDGSPLSVFESGAILLYLADKCRALIPSDPVGRVRALEWTFFQVGGVGPMFGQAGWFRRSAESMPLALERYQNESTRLTQVLESRLVVVPWLAGDAFSIADIANFGWLRHGSSYTGVDLTRFAAVQRWVAAIESRPAVQRGLLAIQD